MGSGRRAKTNKNNLIRKDKQTGWPIRQNGREESLSDQPIRREKRVINQLRQVGRPSSQTR